VRAEKHICISGTHPSQWRASARGLQIVNVETGSPSVLREIARAHTAHGGLRETPQLPPQSGTDIRRKTHFANSMKKSHLVKRVSISFSESLMCKGYNARNLIV